MTFWYNRDCCRPVIFIFVCMRGNYHRFIKLLLCAKLIELSVINNSQFWHAESQIQCVTKHQYLIKEFVYNCFRKHLMLISHVEKSVRVYRAL